MRSLRQQLWIAVRAMGEDALRHFDDTGQFGRIVATSFAKPLKHEPRGFLRYLTSPQAGQVAPPSQLF
jgi:hypothetical protein